VSLSLSLYLYIVPSILSTVLQKEKALVTPQLPKLESFSSLLFRFAFSESKRWESEQKSQIFERENREAWWVLLFFFFFLEGDMGEKDDGLGLGLGLGLSLGLGCGGNLQTSLNMNPIHRPQPSQMVQNLDKRSTPWNEMFQFPGKLSVFALMRCFSFSKLRI
jgi:hypothetical protein